MVHSKSYIIPQKETVTPEIKEDRSHSLHSMRYIFFFVLLFLTISSKAVNIDSLSMHYIPLSTTTIYIAKDKMNSQDKYKQTRYWKKHKRLKACGWTTLGIGVPTMVVGFVGAVVSGYESGGDGEGFGIILGAGAGLTVSSIPLFVFAVKNRQKAIATALGTELDPQLWRKHRQFRIGACTALGIGLAGMATGLMGGAFDDPLYKNPALGAELDRKMVSLRDALYFYLGSKTDAFLLNADNAPTIKRDLTEVLNDYLTQGQVTDILLESYLNS